MTGNWMPLRENHAIDQMAVIINFGQPIPDFALRKVLVQNEEGIQKLGLKTRAESQGFQFSFGEGAAPAAQPISVPGFTFYAAGDTPNSRSEQVELTPMNLGYRCWSYVSWDYTRQRIKGLLSPLLAAANELVPSALLRLEYVDRFRFDGETADAKPNTLLRSSSAYIAPHVFEETNLWHSHTGAVVGTNEQGVPRILQVHIDCLDLPFPPPPNVRPERWVNILTALEDRLAQPGIPPFALDPAALMEKLDDMHASLKLVLNETISDDIAARIFLNAK